MTEALIHVSGKENQGHTSREHDCEPASVRTLTFCSHCGRLIPIGGGGTSGVGGVIECLRCRSMIMP